MQPIEPANPQMVNQGFLDRAIGVLKLDKATYRAIRDDDKALGQAWIIVILAGILNGIGSARQLGKITVDLQNSWQEATSTQANAPTIDWNSVNSQLNSTGAQVSTIISSVISVIVAWLIFAVIARWVARAFFGAQDSEIATMPEMMRLVGWAYVPALLGVLGIIPVLGGIVVLVVVVWGILTMVTALQAGTGLSTGKSWGAWFITSILPGLLIGLFCCIVMGGFLGVAALFGGGGN